MEANYKAFQTAGLMDTMPTVQKDALYIYEVLKTDASRNGHTYISFPDLRQHRLWTQLGHVVSDWSPALAFLSENGVTREERFDSRRNVFLFHNWKAEVDITDGLKEVLDRGIKANRPTWNVDFARLVLGQCVISTESKRIQKNIAQCGGTNDQYCKFVISVRAQNGG